MDSELISETSLKWSDFERDLREALCTESRFDVEKREARVMRNGGGFTSTIVFTTVHWIGEDSDRLPTKFVLKVTAGEELKALAEFGDTANGEFDAIELSRLVSNNELLFYRNAHGRLGLPNDFPIPRFFCGHLKEKGPEDRIPGYLALEWVEEIEARYQYDSLSEYSVLAVLKQIALLNAITFERKEIEEVFPINIAESLNGKFMTSQNNGNMLDKYLIRCPERKTQIELIKRFSKIYDTPEESQRMKSALAYDKRCLTHGDLTQQNFLWRKDPNGNLGIIGIHDWQATHTGNPLADLARFLGIALAPDELRSNMNHYLEFYYLEFNRELPKEIECPWLDLTDFISCFEKMFCLVNAALVPILVVFGSLVVRTASDSEKAVKGREFEAKVDAITDYLTKCLEKWFPNKE